jgi:F420-dependent oxidoreductase-like protein
MRFDIDVAQHQLSWAELLERVKWAEDAGFVGAWVFDHFKALYGDPTGPCLEGWTLLAALAAATERIRLGTLVTGITYRHPSILATEVVTVDHVSNGRVECAIGAAWFEPEHRELGIDFPSDGERISRLEEAAQVLRLLMTTDDASFDGRFYRLDHATYRPRPVQRPHPPIWIGGSGNRLLRIAGRYADAWHGLGEPIEFARKSRLLAEAAEAAGRDPASIFRAASLSLSHPWDDIRGTIEALADAGARCLIVSWPSEGRARLEEFIEEVFPDYRD